MAKSADSPDTAGVSDQIGVAVRTRESFSSETVVVGTSVRMRGVFDFVRVIATSESTVLITGESGTGKEMVANLIHQASSRRQRPFVAVSCAILSESLVESELFGHERGAFTNAIRGAAGRFELADGGHAVPRRHRRCAVGDAGEAAARPAERGPSSASARFAPIPVDVRGLAGSKRELRQLVSEGAFREDLFYRLNVIPDPAPAVARACRRHPGARGPLLQAVFPSVAARSRSPCRPRCWRRSAVTAGPGTCASWRTPASGSRRRASATQ